MDTEPMKYVLVSGGKSIYNALISALERNQPTLTQV